MKAMNEEVELIAGWKGKGAKAGAVQFHNGFGGGIYRI